MFDDDSLDFSATLTAPFHRPLHIDEFRRYCVERVGSAGAKQVEECLDIGEGWTLSLFSIATRSEIDADLCREPVWGWTKGAFAIHDEAHPGGCHAVLSHLESGVAVVFGDNAEELASVAAIIAPLWDWTNLGMDDEQAAKCVLKALALAGYRRINVHMGHGVQIPLFRASAARAAGRA